MPIGEFIKELRKAKDLSQEELARKAGILTSSLSKIEQGIVKDPSWSTMTAPTGGFG